MKIWSYLPRDRQGEGTLWVTHENDMNGTKLLPFSRCRGKADNQKAAEHHNVMRAETQAYGDHPSGRYRIVSVHTSLTEAERDTYGSYFILLDPLSEDALAGKMNGRTGIGMHAGRLNADGTLRATYGCLRIDEATLLVIAGLIASSGQPVEYECMEQAA